MPVNLSTLTLVSELSKLAKKLQRENNSFASQLGRPSKVLPKRRLDDEQSEDERAFKHTRIDDSESE
jgi:hypothetical protein